MKIELRNRETSGPAYSAEVLIDGKGIGHIENLGDGGETLLRIPDSALRSRMIEEIEALPPVNTEWGPMPMDAGLFFAYLFDEVDPWSE